MRDERVDKFYFSHLNYAGRGNIHRAKDAQFAATRDALDLLFERAWQAAQAGLRRGVRDRQQRCRRRLPAAVGAAPLAALARRAARAAGRLGRQLRRASTSPTSTTSATCTPTRCGGTTRWATCASGRSRRSGRTPADPLMAGLKAQPRPVDGRCAACAHLAICGGNTRVRAQQVTGDPWAEDPGCYLDDEEIGAAPAARACAVEPPFAVKRGASMSRASRADSARMPLSCALRAAACCARCCAHKTRPRTGRRRSAAPLYQQHCAACHGEQRTGGMGPALLPESLERLRRPRRSKVDRRTAAPATQMPAFRDKLAADEIAALAPSGSTRRCRPAPTWGDADIRASRVAGRRRGTAAAPSRCGRPTR